MGTAKEARDSQLIEWLTKPENPSVRYFALLHLLDKRESDPDVVGAKAAIMTTGVVPAILDRLNQDGYWGKPGRFYLDKYGGSVWQLLILAELGADGSDPRIKRAGEYVLDACQDHESHGFSPFPSAKGGGRHSEVIPCLTGNLAWSLSKLGFEDDPRIRKALDWICTYQRFDDGTDGPPLGWPYSRYEMCWGRHSCHMGVVKALKALSAIPEARRSREANDTIKGGVEYLLAHRIHKRSHYLGAIAKPGWLRFGFPLMYQTDVLEILGILVDLGCAHDERICDALDVVRQSRGPDGKWKLRNTFNGKTLVDIEEKGKSSKWITYRALRALRARSA